MDVLIIILIVTAVALTARGLAKRRRHGRSVRASRSPRDMDAIAESARGMVRVVNESLQIAASTGNPQTKASRVRVAAETLERLKIMRQAYPFLLLTEMDAVEADIQRLTLQADLHDYAAMADGNEKGRSLEAEGRIDDAIAVYERLAAEGVDTPFTYRRLVILYRKRKDTDGEMRSLDLACVNVPLANPQHHAWFVERRENLRAKLGR